jgi:hypothetical protein
MQLAIIISLIFYSTLVLAGDTKYSLVNFSNETQVEFKQFFKRNYFLEKDINRLSHSANLKLKNLLRAKLEEDRKHSELNLNLISWPSEDKLIYKYGEVILKDKN